MTEREAIDVIQAIVDSEQAPIPLFYDGKLALAIALTVLRGRVLAEDTRVLCPWCGEEMELETGQDADEPDLCFGHFICAMCNACSPSVERQHPWEVVGAAYTAAVRRGQSKTESKPVRYADIVPLAFCGETCLFECSRCETPADVNTRRCKGGGAYFRVKKTTVKNS